MTNPRSDNLVRPIVVADSVNTLDMLVPLLLQMRADGRSTPAVTVLKFWENTRVRECNFLFRAACAASSHVYCVGRHPLYDQMAAACDECGVSFRQMMPIGEIADHADSTTVLLRSHADIYEIPQTLGQAVRQAGGAVMVCLGGCYPPHDSIPLPYFASARPDLADLFLVYADGYRAPLASVGYSRFARIGFPKLYPAWLETVRASKNAARLIAGKRGKLAAILTRGEIAPEPPHIMPNGVLREILVAAIEELRNHLGPCSILLKPHPLQDESVLNGMIDRYPDVAITYEHAGVLACAADVFVTTWSTTIFDALALGTPAIEFFVPNDYFLSVYPAGSAFKNLGIPAAEDRASFSAILETLANGTYRQPDVAKLFEHEMDLSILDSRQNGE